MNMIDLTDKVDNSKEWVEKKVVECTVMLDEETLLLMLTCNYFLIDGIKYEVPKSSVIELLYKQMFGLVTTEFIQL